jgi:hypothetical protein
MCKTTVNMKIYFNNIRKHEHQWNEQGHGAKLYLKLMLNRLKVIGSYLYIYLFVNLVQGNFHKSFHMPIKNFF